MREEGVRPYAVFYTPVVTVGRSSTPGAWARSLLPGGGGQLLAMLASLRRVLFPKSDAAVGQTARPDNTQRGDVAPDTGPYCKHASG